MGPKTHCECSFMPANRFPPLLQKRSAIAAISIATAFGCGAAAWSVASAAGLTVLMADDSAAHKDFVVQLRETQEAGSPIDLVQVAAGIPGVDQPRAPSPRKTSGGSGPAGADMPITMAVGMIAARVAVERPGQDPLVLVMLSRLDYEILKMTPALRNPDRQIGVVLREPAMSDQLALIAAVLPNKRRLGVVATAESEPVVREMEAAAQGWDLQVEYAPDAKALAAALRVLVPHSDALLVLPDMIGDNQAATLTVLRAGAGAGLPVFGTNDGLVRSGGLAAAVSTPTQMARQARAMGQKLAANGGAGVMVEPAAPATVRVNTTVARGLGLRLPDERELTERVTAVR